MAHNTVNNRSVGKWIGGQMQGWLLQARAGAKGASEGTGGGQTLVLRRVNDCGVLRGELIRLPMGRAGRRDAEWILM